MESIDPRDLLVKVACILDDLKIAYVVTGGMAVYVWGRPRFTADIDIVIQFKPAVIDTLAKALMQLGNAGYINREMIARALEHKGEFNFIDGVSGIKVDFWVVGDMPFEKEQFNRRKAKVIQGHKVYFCSPEDLILSKLRWYKESESSRQLEDIESILTLQKKLDRKYLRKWAKTQSTLKILESLR